MDNPRLIFAGTPAFALASLSALVAARSVHSTSYIFDRMNRRREPTTARDKNWFVAPTTSPAPMVAEKNFHEST